MSSTDLKDLLNKFNNPELVKEAEAITEEEVKVFTAGLKPIGSPEKEKELGKLTNDELVLYLLADKKDKAADVLLADGNAFFETEEYKALGKPKKMELIEEKQKPITELCLLRNKLRAAADEVAVKRLGSEYEVVRLRKDGVLVGIINPYPICPFCGGRHRPIGGFSGLLLSSMFGEGVEVVVVRI